MGAKYCDPSVSCLVVCLCLYACVQYISNQMSKRRHMCMCMTVSVSDVVPISDVVF